MAKIDAAALAEQMLAAAKVPLEGHWKDVRPYAETEMNKFAQTAVLIQMGRADGSISKKQAKILVEMQKNASQAVFTAVETVGMIAAQDAVNAAIGGLRAAGNKAIGVALL